ncbi:hypothetical protein PO124_04250 [Bacillus licheniformis]|nr:hypothetical protein [Bacillus licheniformis]
MTENGIVAGSFTAILLNAIFHIHPFLVMLNSLKQFLLRNLPFKTSRIVRFFVVFLIADKPYYRYEEEA